jgi:hypothetical protein
MAEEKVTPVSNPENNRSSALSPELMAMVNSMVVAAVQASVKSIFTELKPALEGMALTPEKLREANKPYVDPASERRRVRETLKFRADEKDLASQIERQQKACPHTYPTGAPSISLVHNHPDHHPRGICMQCGSWIHPHEWRIGAPTDEFPRGLEYKVPAHAMYPIVLQIDRQRGGGST